uniref:Uncharacterized protein n=1 Tax=Anguilla anguilla TaxID=7936 RepID=A0A0E9Q8X8_ANGAN
MHQNIPCEGTLVPVPFFSVVQMASMPTVWMVSVDRGLFLVCLCLSPLLYTARCNRVKLSKSFLICKLVKYCDVT